MAPRTRTPPQVSSLHAPLRNLERALATQARTAELYRRGALPGSPTRVDCGPLALLISSTPAEDTLEAYVATLEAHRVRHVVRVCEDTYNKQLLRDRGFVFHDLPFPDGEAPPSDVVDAWLHLLDLVYALDKAPTQASTPLIAMGPAAAVTDVQSGGRNSPDGRVHETVAIHCAAGLGRAPVLVALSLIELGLDPFDAVALIRARRRGAINGIQFAFLQDYVPRRNRPPRLTHRKSRSASLTSFLAKSIKASSARRASSRPSTPPSGRMLSNTPSPTSVIEASEC
jgi:protein tyrosine phosphatase type IVA